MNPDLERRFRSRWRLLLIAQALLAALLAGVLLREHAAVRRAEVDRLQSQAKVVDDNLVRQLQSADKVLREVRPQFGADGAVVEPKALSARLRLLTDAMPGVNIMTVLDARGTVVAANRAPLLGKQLAHRDFYGVPGRARDASKLFVLPPFFTQYGNQVMIVSRAVLDDAGRFAGIVSAELDPEYFTVLLRSVLYAPDMRAALVHQDGVSFLGVPAATEDVPAATRHTVTARTLDRGDLHLHKAMVVHISRDFAAVFAPWRLQAWQLAGFWACGVFASSLLLSLGHRRHRETLARDEAVAGERRAASARVEQALQGADLGLWELHVPTQTFVVNDRERELLGYGPDDALPQGPAWRELIPPEDRARLDAAVLPHLQGREPNYDCEHRMRHRDGRYVWLFSRGMVVERDARGTPLRIVGTHMDISERRRVEEQLAEAAARLRDNEEELRLLTDNMPALVSRLDLEQRYRFANRAYTDWLGIDCAALIGRSLQEVHGAEHHATIRHRLEQALTGTKVRYECDLPTPAGLRRVDFTLVPRFDAGGAVTGLYTLATDLSARYQAERRLARSEERLSLALEASGAALFDWDLGTGTIYHSGQAQALRGAPCREAVTPVEEQQQHVHPDDRAQVLEHIRDAVGGRTPLYSAEFRLRCADGGWRWVRAGGRVVERNPQGRAMRLAGTYTDIQARKLAEGRLRQRAECDALTGLPNRALFDDRLQQAMARAGRGKPMALLYLDIDHFKGINDTLGHEAGDAVLKAFARRMESVVRESDTVARLGGDEFTIILEGVRDAADASMIAAKLVAVLGEPVPLADGRVRATASIGVALCRPGEIDAAALLRRADAALYEAKRRGRNSSFCTESAAGEAVRA